MVISNVPHDMELIQFSYNELYLTDAVPHSDHNITAENSYNIPLEHATFPVLKPC